MFEFKRAIPEETGISSARILNVLKELEEKEVPMHSLLIMKNDRLIFEKYYAPYKRDTLHRMFSITKSFTAIAIFLLADEGKLALDDRICDYFPEYVSEGTHEYIRMMTIRNLLEMRTCHASTTYKVNLKSDWVESFFVVPPTHKPGTVFHYDTSAAHTLCALAEKLSGGDMLDYLKDRLLKYVDFSADSYLVKDPFGVSIGGSGLMATPMDILKVLYILDKGGTICCSDGQVLTLLSKELIEEATSNISDSIMTGPLSSESQGYGMQIWRNEKGGFVLYGMGGQLAISIPSEDLLVVTTADTQGMQGGNQIIYDAIYRNLLNGQQSETGDIRAHAGSSACSDVHAHSDIQSYPDVQAYADTLSIAPPRLPAGYLTGERATSGYGNPPGDPYAVPDFIREMAATAGSSATAGSDDSAKSLCLKYSLAENPSGFESMTLFLSQEKACFIEFMQKERPCRILFGLGRMQQGNFPIYDTPYTAGGIFTRSNNLYVRAHLIGESVGSVRIQLYFEKAEVTVFMRKVEETYFKEFDGHLQGRLI